MASTDEVELFAKLGITLLLFVVGLKLDPHEIRAVGPVAIATGISQIVLTGGIGYLMGLGLGLTHINQSVLGLITLVGLITMGLSSYMILYSHAIYPRLSGWLDMLERQVIHPHHPEESNPEWTPVDFIVFGLGRYGGSVVRDLCHAGFTVLGVDFDPEVVTAWNREGLRTLYGDADDPELAALLPLHNARWIVSTVPKCDVGLTLLHTLQHYDYQGSVALTSHSQRDENILLEAGADTVLLPFRDAAKEAARMLAQVEITGN